MSKTALSVTLATENLLWLKARARAAHNRSLSSTLDAILKEARQAKGQIRSVVGRVRFLAGSTERQGRKEIREMFNRSLGRRRTRG